MSRLGKLKRQAIQEANKKNLGIEDTEKEVLNENLGVGFGFANPAVTLSEEDLDETTADEKTEEEGDGEKPEDVVEEQDEAEFGEEEMDGIDVGSPQPGDGEGGLGEPTDAQVFAEGSFSKYNITLED